MHIGPSQGSPLSLGPQPPSPHLPHAELLSAPTSTPKPSAPHTATASSSIFLAALNTALLLPTSASQLWAPAAIITSSLLPQVSAWAQPHSCCYNHSPLPMDTRNVSCPRQEPCPRAKPQQIHPAAPRLSPHPWCAFPSTSTPGNFPKAQPAEHGHCKGLFASSGVVMRQRYQPSVKGCAHGHKS